MRWKEIEGKFGGGRGGVGRGGMCRRALEKEIKGTRIEGKCCGEIEQSPRGRRKISHLLKPVIRFERDVKRRLEDEEMVEI